MGKHEFNSVKAISNRIKSKGLQQLRFYCQMCEKQCRDENGFKCHSTSEAHMRQMALFAANPDRFMDTFSAGFEKGFMELLQRRFGTRRVKANYVYNEYIQDRDHIHMNGTMWTTLTDFVKYLGRTGKCVIEEETSGPDIAAWWITWINRDPEAVRRQEIALKRREREQGDEAREIDEVDLIAARARAEAGLSDNDNDKFVDEEEEEDEKDEEEEEEQEDDGSNNNTRKVVNIKKGTIQSELKREEGDAPLRISLSAPSAAIVMPLGGKKRSRWESELEQSMSGPTAPLLSSSSDSHFTHSVVNSSSISQLSSQARPVSQAEMLMREEQALKQKKKEREEAIASAALAASAVAAAAASATNAKASQIVSSTVTSSTSSNVAENNEEWVVPGIIVKVMNKKVGGGKYYKQKGKVMSVNADGFTGIISMLDTGDILQIDQQDLETVVPAIGKQVLVLNGKGKGCRAELINLHVETFSADLELEGGERLNNILYENFSKSSE